MENIKASWSQANWADKVWFKGHIPSHAFMMCVARLDRLPTRSCLASWGLQIETCCCVCNHYHETRDHIFIRCAYAEEIWKMAIRKLGYIPVLFYTLEALLVWIGLKVTHCPSILRKLMVQAIIYRVWRKRNQRVHNESTISVQMSFKEIDKQIKLTHE